MAGAVHHLHLDTLLSLPSHPIAGASTLGRHWRWPQHWAWQHYIRVAEMVWQYGTQWLMASITLSEC